MSQDIEQQLISAISDNDIDNVKALLDRGANPNTTNEHGRAALMFAICGSFLPLAKLLIERDADVSRRDPLGKTPLIEAAWRGSEWVEIIRLLVEKGANINDKDNDGMTALMWAQNVEVAKLIIELGADLNATNAYGETALSYASHNNHNDIVELLQSSGLHVETQLPKEGKCNFCKQTVALTLAKIGRFDIGSHYAEYFYYCPDCYRDNPADPLARSYGRLLGENGKVIKERRHY
jgi:ankyrin repeat protein